MSARCTRVVSWLVVLAVLTGATGVAFAAPAPVAAPLTPISIVINGVRVGADVAPELIKDRVMVPARIIAETLGGTVEWLENKQTVLVYNHINNDGLALKIGSLEYSTILTEGRGVQKFDVAPQIISGRTLVSVRLLATFLGADVKWDSATRTVNVTGPAFSGEVLTTPSQAIFSTKFGGSAGSAVQIPGVTSPGTPATPGTPANPSTPGPITEIPVSPEGKTAILGKPAVTVEVAAAWARSRGATEEFISLAPLYWSRADRPDAARADVAYAQAAKETGFGRFGGVINATFRNPCGMKTSAGSAVSTDYIPSAHQRFASWKDGVDAHLDHLELYAGRVGTPYASTLDPRHFPSLKGRAQFVEDLGGKWAPSSTYGTDIMKNGVNQMLEMAKAFGK